MTTERYPLVHIGYLKTASTWLQRHLFASAAIGFVMPVSNRELSARVVPSDPHDFDPEACQAFFAARFRDAREAGLVPVVSRERLSGSIVHGGHESKENGNRLHAVFPHGRVLIVIREQRRMLVSHYGQYVKGVGTPAIGDYLRRPDARRAGGRRAGFPLEHFQYDELIRHYIGLFGGSNVLVVAYEQLRADPIAFVSSIVKFAGLNGKDEHVAALAFDDRANPSLSGASLAVKRRMNRMLDLRVPFTHGVLFSRQRWQGRLLRSVNRLDDRLPSAWKASSDRRLLAEVEAVVDLDRYAESNRVTAELTGIDLAQYGYVIGG